MALSKSICVACGAGLVAGVLAAWTWHPINPSPSPAPVARLVTNTWSFDELTNPNTATRSLGVQEALAEFSSTSLSDEDLDGRIAEAIGGLGEVSWLPGSAATDVAEIIRSLALAPSAQIARHVGVGDMPVSVSTAEDNLGIAAYEQVSGQTWTEATGVPAASLAVMEAAAARGDMNRLTGFVNAATTWSAAVGSWSAPAVFEGGVGADIWHCPPSLGRGWWCPGTSTIENSATTLTIAFIGEYADGWRSPLHARFVLATDGHLRLASLIRYCAATDGARLEY